MNRGITALVRLCLVAAEVLASCAWMPVLRSPRWTAATPRVAQPPCMAVPDQEYEVSIRRPLGLQFEEREGSGVYVAMVYDGGNAAQAGIQEGDRVVATSASLGSQMWPKNTIAGVESAIQTRLDGNVKLRLQRSALAATNLRDWTAPLRQTYEVEVGQPLGLVLRELPVGSPQPGVEVAEVVEGGSAAASRLIRVGDVLAATSASVGDQMWAKTSLEGAVSAINTRLALAPTVRLRLVRLESFGPWVAELDQINRGERRLLSVDALRSLRAQRRQVAELAQPSEEAQEVIRNLTLPAIIKIIAQRSRRRRQRRDAATSSAAEDARRVANVMRRLRSARVALDCSLTTALMSASMRCGYPKLALSAFELLVEGGGGQLRAGGQEAPGYTKPDAAVYTALIRANAACGQQAEALAVMQRMRAEQIRPSVATYNALMAVCARGGDRQGLLDHFGMIRSSGLRPSVESWNVILDYCANRGQASSDGQEVWWGDASSRKRVNTSPHSLPLHPTAISRTSSPTPHPNSHTPTPLE